MHDPTSSPPSPYATPAPLVDERGIFGDGARRRRGGFLYRDIEFRTPFPCRLVYSGWWFVQRIWINGHRVWWKVSWLDLQREITFHLPAALDALQPLCRLRIVFGMGLRIRRFQLIIGGQAAYDEIN